MKSSHPSLPPTPRISPARLLLLALILALGSPFGLYWALQNNQDGLAVACFALIVLGLALTLWRG